MLTNYFKIAWRNLMKSKVFSLINILGLSTGLAACMLITLYVLNETSYDKYQKKADRIYQVATEFKGLGDFKKLPNTPAAMGEIMQQVFPEIEMTTRMVRLFNEDKTLLQVHLPNGSSKSFYETRGYLVDSTFFRMFTYHFIEGNPATSMDDPNTIVISQDIADKLFGSESALNKVIHVSSSTNGESDCVVTGVFKPIDKPSHMDGRFFLGMMGGNVAKMIKNAGTNLANNNMYYTYLLLKPGANPKNIAAQFPAFIDKYAGKDLRAYGFYKGQYLVALPDIHLHSGTDNDVTPSGSVTYLYILGSIALFILLIACINFMNLATARSSKRSAEVGMRKVLGAERRFLIAQFLGESVLMSIIAFGFALLITELFIPAFNSLSGKNLSLTFSDYKILIVFFVLSVITGLIAGSYPAFYLSSFNPAKVLKGKFQNSLAAVSLRKGLVIFQFVISVILIIASVVIAQQMGYLRSADLGFDKESQIVIPLRTENAKKIYTAFRSNLLKESYVENVGASAFYPGISNFADNILYKQGESMQQGKDVKMNYVDPGFLQTLHIQPVAGRLFSEDFPSDSSHGMVLNEKAIQSLGFSSPQEAVGKKLYFDFQGNHYFFDIVGVVKDFHFEDLRMPITPYGFQLNLDPQYNYMVVHVKSADLQHSLANVGQLWKKLNPSEPFEYSFLDKDFQKNYDAEIRLATIVKYFTTIAILISCLGLFGLATFSAEQRIKEIGVRKTLGASVTSIVTLLSKDFLKLVVISIIIASPLAWWVMNQWLNGFAYRIKIDWTVFATTSVLAIAIALVTISYQAIKAALMNPVRSLRSE